MSGQLETSVGNDILRSMRLSTEGVPPEEQLDAWRNITASMSDVQPLDGAPRGYSASMEMVDLDALQLVRFDQDPVIYRHTKEHIGRSGIDHWLLTVVKTGGLKTISDRGDIEAEAGSVLFKTFATPFQGKMEKTDFSCLFIGREQHWELADELDKASYRLVAGPMSDILGAFLLSLDKHASRLTVGEVPAINQAFLALLKATLRRNADALDAARQPIAAAQFDIARRFINEHLKSPNLNPEYICARLGISRRQLYYLFEHQGGVAKYIRNRRLAACYKALTRVTEKKLISSIAFEYGFTNLSTFYRQFQARHGFSPGEARAARLSGHTPPTTTTTATTFGEWMQRVAEN